MARHPAALKTTVVTGNKAQLSYPRTDDSDIIMSACRLGGILGQQEDIGGSECSAAVVCLSGMNKLWGPVLGTERGWDIRY